MRLHDDAHYSTQLLLGVSARLSDSLLHQRTRLGLTELLRQELTQIVDLKLQLSKPFGALLASLFKFG